MVFIYKSNQSHKKISCEKNAASFLFYPM